MWTVLASRRMDAYHRIKAWMEINAPEVLGQLRPPASAEDLLAAETALGFAIPQELSQILAVNDGSDDECGFFGWLAFVGATWMVHARTDLMLWVESDRTYAVESPSLFSEIYPELSSDEWIAIGHQGYADQLALHARTGRVFTVTKEVPAITLAAGSLAAYLESYANDLENGRYHVEEGFGGVYLERA